MAKTCVFLGPPGCGKGTQAQLLSQRKGFSNFDIGKAFREASTGDSPNSQEIRSSIQSGQLVPIHIVKKFVSSFLSVNSEKDIVLDGFPRSIEQANLLDEQLENYRREITRVIFFKIDESLIVERILNRIVCSNCGALYNLKTLKPKVEMICDRCGRKMVKRVDDSTDVLQERAKIYQISTKPLLSFYKKRGLLSSVDATKSVEEVYAQVERLIFNNE